MSRNAILQTEPAVLPWGAKSPEKTANRVKNRTKGKKTRVFTCVSGKFFVPLQPENSNKSAKW